MLGTRSPGYPATQGPQPPTAPGRGLRRLGCWSKGGRRAPGKVKSGSGRRTPAGAGNHPNAHSRGSHLCAGAGRGEREACAWRRSRDCGAALPRAAGGASGPRGGGSSCCRMAGTGARGRAGKSQLPAEARRRRSPCCRRCVALGLATAAGSLAQRVELFLLPLLPSGASWGAELVGGGGATSIRDDTHVEERSGGH